MGTVTAHPSTFDRIRTISLEHVHRSRTEPGCISHSVQVDCEDPMRLVFFERWSDLEALHAHFRNPESGKFIAGLNELAAHATGPHIYEVTDTKSAKATA